MTPRMLLLGVVTLLLCACQPNDPVPDYRSATWVYNPAATVDTVYAGAALTMGSRLTFTDSTAVIYNPYRRNKRFELPLREAAADTIRYTVRVTPVSENEIQVTATTPEREYSRSYFRQTAPPDTVAVEELLDRAFRITFDEGEAVDLHFGIGDPGGKGVTGPVLEASYVAPEGGSFVHTTQDAGRPVLFFLNQEEQLTLFQFGLRQLSRQLGQDTYYTVHRDEDDGYYLRYLTRSGNVRTRGRVTLEELPPIIPPDVPISNVVNLLNGGRFTVDTELTFPDSIGILFKYEEDFAGVTVEELGRLDLLFSPQGDFVLFAGDRQLQQRRWVIGPARRTIRISRDGEPGPGGWPIVSYSEEEMTFRFPVDVQTVRPRGQRLLSYGKVDALVRVRAWE